MDLPHSGEAPPPPPEEPKKYQKTDEESNGIIAMMDALVKDLDKEMTEAELTEKDARSWVPQSKTLTLCTPSATSF